MKKELYEVRQHFTYKPEGRDVTYTWDVSAILDVFRGIKWSNSTISPTEMQWLFERNKEVANLNESTIAQADLDKPILIAEMPPESHGPNGERHIVIDGWHRMARAIRENVTLKAYVMDLAMSEHFRIK